MSEPDRTHLNRSRAESFGTIAEQYDRFRPGYPPELIDDLAALAGRSVLDIGCGTGKAATALAARGLDVLGVEIDERMAEVARGHGLAVEVGSFESWDDGGRLFDLIVCGQAWHWIEPEAGAAKAARLLRPGGVLALFWNSDTMREPARSAIDGVYRRDEPQLFAWGAQVRDQYRERPFADPLERSGLFEQVEIRRYASRRVDSSAQWLGMIGTHSDHLLLDEARRARLFGDLRAAIDGAGGAVVNDVSTYTILARRRMAG